MATEIATGYISIVPSLKGFNSALTAQVAPMMAGVGADAGKQLGDAVGKGYKASLVSKLDDVGENLSKWVTVPLVGAGVVSAKVAADFESSMSKLAQAIGKPGDPLKNLTQLAKTMGAETQYSAKEAADAMVALAKGGFTEAEIQAGALKTAMDLAAAGQLDLEEAADLTVKSMGAFNLTAEDSQSIADALAGGADSSASNVSDLAWSLTQAGAAAHNSGMSLQETTAALAAMADKGILGSDAGTSLKTMFGRLIPDTTRAANAMRDLGLMTDEGQSAFVNADGSFKSMAEIAEILKTKLGGLTEAQRTTALETIFGTDAYRAAAVLMDQGAKGLGEYEKATSKVGAAQAAAKANLGPTARAIEEAKGAAETAAIALGGALAPTITKVAKGAQSLFGWFGNLPGPVQQTAAATGVLAAAMGPLLVVTSKVITAFGVVKGALLSERAALIANKVAWLARQAAYGVQVMWAVVTSIGQATAAWLLNTTAVVANRIALVASRAAMLAVRGAVMAWTVAQWALNTALTMNPIGAVIMAIAALVAIVVLLWNKNEGFRNAVIAAWEAIKKAAAVVWEGIKKIIEVVWDAIAWYVKTYIAVVKAVITTAWDFLQAASEAVWGAIQKVIEVVWGAIKWYVTTYINVVKTVITTVWEAIKKATEIAWEAVKVGIINPVRDAVEIVRNVVSAVSTWLSGAWTAIKQRAATAWGSVKDAIADAIRAARDVLHTVVNNVTGWLSSAWETIKSAAGTAWEGVKDAILSPIRALWDGFRDALGITKGGFTEDGPLGRLVGVFDAVVKRVAAVFSGIRAAIVAPIAEAFQWVNDNVIAKLNESVLAKFGELRIPNLPVPKYATGGWVSGPGSGTSDSVLARLSNGEFVVNAKAARDNAALLMAINSGGSLQTAQTNSQSGGIPGIGALGELVFKKGAEAVVKTVGAAAMGLLRNTVGGSVGGELALGGVQTVIDSVSKWAGKQELAPTKLMEALASRFERWADDSKWVGVSTCLRNVNLSLQELGRQFGFTVNGNATAGTAYEGNRGVAAAGMMHRNVNAPRGSLGHWDPGIGNYAGHIAVMDGRGNFINNFSGGNVVKLPLSSAMSGWMGWSYPWSLIAGGAKYDNGGYLPPGWSMNYNGTGKPEAVLTSEQWDAIGAGRSGVTNNWTVYAQEEPTVDATMRAWRQWEALQGV